MFHLVRDKPPEAAAAVPKTGRISNGVKFFDAHTHAQFAAYDEDRDLVMGRARRAGVNLVNVGTTRATSEAAVRLAQQHPGFCFATIGVHPSHASSSDYVDPHEMAAGGEEKLDLEFYRKIVADPAVVAIGECGLDYFRVTEKAVREKQKNLFEEHIGFAYEVGKPLMIHCRQAFSELIVVLKSRRSDLLNPAGVVHFFTGTKEEAVKLLELGFYFTFGGVITFVRDYDAVIKIIPLDRILSETDAPYVTPEPYRSKPLDSARGKRNEPAYVVEVVKKLAELKSLSIEAMAAQILKNAEQVFSITLPK